MILPEKPVHISVLSPYILQTYPMVEQKTGIKFGEDFLWHIFNPEISDWFPDSWKPAIALTIFKEFYPEKQLAFASDLQYSLHVEGRDLCDNESYRHLLVKYKITEVGFFQKISDPIYKQKASDEFSLVKQLSVTGYPTLFLQHAETKFYLISRGYTAYETISQRLNELVNQNNLFT
jgi:putative protein-disulfide isomerase